MFEKASRLKLRFGVRPGSQSVEDLWDLSKEELSEYAEKLYADLEKKDKLNLLKKKTKENSLTELRFNIVKYIVETKVAEEENKENDIVLKQDEQELLDILAEKQRKSKEALTEEQILAKLEEIRAKRK